jgi:hypothetical protein
VRTLLATGLAFGVLAFPGDAGTVHSAIVFKDTLIGVAAFVLGFALAWLVLAARSRLRASPDRSDRP